jgi:hypothetical protein
MRVLVLYHPKSEHEGKVLDYAHEYHTRQPDHELELLSLETKEGAQLAALYDVVRYPAILVIAENGSLLKFWQDDFPLMNDIEYYMQQGEQTRKPEPGL